MIARILEDLQHVYGDKPHRMEHVLGVRDTALELGKKAGCNLQWLELA